MHFTLESLHTAYGDRLLEDAVSDSGPLVDELEHRTAPDRLPLAVQLSLTITSWAPLSTERRRRPLF